MNIESVIAQNREAIQMLLHRRGITGPVSMDAIRQAHNRWGEYFMMDLLKIITPNDTSNFGENFGDMLNPGGFIDTAVKSQQAAQPPKGKFWNFWDNLLQRVDSTGKTIGQFKYDAQGNVVPVSQPMVSPGTIYIIAAVIIVAIVAILIFKKK